MTFVRRLLRALDHSTHAATAASVRRTRSGILLAAAEILETRILLAADLADYDTLFGTSHSSINTTTIRPGETLSITARIYNAGDMPASGAEVEFFISEGEYFLPKFGLSQPLDRVEVGALAASEFADVNWTARLPQWVWRGTYYVGWRILFEGNADLSNNEGYLDEQLTVLDNPPPPPQDLIGYYQGDFYVAASNGSAFSTRLGDRWANVPWTAIRYADFDGDGNTDILGLDRGQWWIGLSRGDAYETSLWAEWADVDWRDVSVADVNADGRKDVVARYNGQWWVALSTGTAFGPASLWAEWADVDWERVFTQDLTGDGRDDLLVKTGGDWYAAASTGTGFSAVTLWARWANVEFDAILTGDINGDFRRDIVGFLDGRWYVGFSSGSSFGTGLWTEWADVVWHDAVVGDFDGNGLDDIAARHVGQWWVGQSAFNYLPGSYAIEPSLWATWADVAWQDVRVGDFNGDGKSDLAGRYAGQWWVGRSTETAFATSLWETWADVDWNQVAVVQADGPVAAAAPTVAATERPPQTTLSTEPAEEDALFSLLWSRFDEDEDLVGIALGV